MARTTPLLPVSSCCCLARLGVGAGGTPRTGDPCCLRHLAAAGWVRGGQRGSQDSAWPSRMGEGRHVLWVIVVLGL